MKRLAKLGLCAVLGLGIASSGLTVVGDATARGPKKAVASVDPPTVKNRSGIQILPVGVHWGMTHEQLTAFYDRMIDRDFGPLYKKAQPGPQTQRLDAAVANAKAAFRRSKVAFGNLPTGLDSTALKGEYSYGNGESVMSINRRGAGTRHFFFIKKGNKEALWKIYDEVPAGEKRPLGPSYEEAVKRLALRFGVVGRVTQPDYAINRNYMEVDWQDQTTRLRALDRSGTKIIGVVYEDRATLGSLASLRTNKPKDVAAIDPEVEALIRPPAPPQGPKDGKDGKDDKDDKNKKK